MTADVIAVLWSLATASLRQPLPVVEMLILLVVSTAVWIFLCVFYPFTRCGHPRCDGGRRVQPGKDRRHWRHCPTCKGTGKRVRPGARFWRAVLGMDKE
ncbi:MAG: hypothetical protein ACRDS1_06740 [Pseudonocardiaceae bacterium]